MRSLTRGGVSSFACVRGECVGRAAGPLVAGVSVFVSFGRSAFSQVRYAVVRVGGKRARRETDRWAGGVHPKPVEADALSHTRHSIVCVCLCVCARVVRVWQRRARSSTFPSLLDPINLFERRENCLSVKMTFRNRGAFFGRSGNAGRNG